MDIKEHTLYKIESIYYSQVMYVFIHQYLGNGEYRTVLFSDDGRKSIFNLSNIELNQELNCKSCICKIVDIESLIEVFGYEFYKSILKTNSYLYNLKMSNKIKSILDES